MVIQEQDANDTSPNTIVAPISHTKSKLKVIIPIKTQYDENGNILLDGNVLLGNIVTISKVRLGDYITDLFPDEMENVDKAIMVSLGIEHKNIELNSIKKDFKTKKIL